ncbi:hypothetical protein XCR1_1040008 [Xenorhabdus cabanillasii JM26]|uniref:Uncharacterized protein n=1 Tax=Xenorhabdus cabanillasii JM26 TaxID=1427517 RepID=W1IMN1_9GAMM|nr:hypothetical protein Xcab_00015 [Xenorhabdus cabanillasii JM26]CDL79083.1 hypothetical protein XCR1_1040008 [Xenorhabdus cabanillasii JM26]
MKNFFNFTILTDRHPLAKNKLPTIYSEWGPLYSQTIAIPPLSIITNRQWLLLASSIISEKEDSFTNPTYIPCGFQDAT